MTDRRKYLITITEKGINLAIDFMDKLSGQLEEKFYRLSTEDKDRYIEAINTLEYILNKEELN